MNLRSKKLIGATTLTAMVAIGLSATTSAHQNKERFVDSQYRHDLMEVVKYSVGNIGKIVQKKVDVKDGQLAAHAEILAKAAASAKDAFEKDTRGIKGFTEAKDNIWEDWEDFSERMDKFAADTQAFADATKSGDNAKIGAGIGAVFKNCKSCHDKYKSE